MTENIGSTLLGTIIAHADTGAVFPDGITAAMFESSKDRVIFNTASEMIREGIPPNLVLLSERLKSDGQIDKAGGFDYLASLTSLQGASFPSQLNYYGETLKTQAADKAAVQAIKAAAEGLKAGGPELVVPR